MQHHHTQQQDKSPQGFIPSCGTATYPQNQQQYQQAFRNHQQYPYYPQNQQASQSQGTATPQHPVYYPRLQTRQASPVPVTQNARPMYYYDQPGAGIVIQGNTRPQINCRTREQNEESQTSRRIAHEQQKKECNERFGRVPVEERRVVADRRANNTKKFHIMNIIAPFSALAILIAGFFAIFNPVTINDRHSVQENEAGSAYKAPAKQVISPVETKPSPSQITDKQEISRKPAPRVFTRTSRRSRSPRGIASPNKIMVTSYPSGALVSANGRTLGRTPYTWHDPAIYGMVVLTLEKSGYASERQQVEFTGGTLRRNFVLTEAQAGGKETAAAPSGQAPLQAPQNTVTKPAVAPTPAPAARAKLPKPRGPQGVIFLSSIPPNADVYLKGKKIGRTNTDLTITAGTHRITLVKGDKQLVKQLTVVAGKNPSQLVRLR